jgi:hypothetical protein
LGIFNGINLCSHGHETFITSAFNVYPKVHVWYMNYLWTIHICKFVKFSCFYVSTQKIWLFICWKHYNVNYIYDWFHEYIYKYKKVIKHSNNMQGNGAILAIGKEMSMKVYHS